MFPEGTFNWQAMTLDGATIDREAAGVSAHHLDTAELKWFRIWTRFSCPFGSTEAEPGISLNGIHIGDNEVRITTPSRFKKIRFTKRKTFPLDMSTAPREIYILTLTEGAEQIVIMVEPKRTRVLRKEPAPEVA